jgi:uncharacterized protein (DUF433 family)
MQHSRISTNPAVMLGKPCIAGTRITVELTQAELLEAFPQIAAPDIDAALTFAAEAVNQQRAVAAE